MQYNYITNDLEDAKILNGIPQCRLMIDLERLGKEERQAGTNSFISTHQIEDIPKIQSVFKGNIIVRSNPVHENSSNEIQQIMQFKPRFIMVPMTESVSQILQINEMLQGHTKIIPLIETKKGLEVAKEVSTIEGVEEMYLGLNDLHLDLKLKFMFEPLAIGLVDKFVNAVKPSTKPYGFGGVSTLGSGTLSADKILLEHIRLGSSRVILSRSFKKNLTNLKYEVQKISEFINQNIESNQLQLDHNRNNVIKIIDEITASMS